MSKRALLVSIHDVTPALFEPVQSLWGMCRSRGITPALLVVPNWHGAWPIEEHAGFVQWVRGRAADGAEIFLHGERHDEEGSPRMAVDSLRAFGRTSNEGEFLTLDEPAARARIERGVGRLRALSLTPIGFVPPAWLARLDTHDAVAHAGLAISENVSRIFLHKRGARLISPALRWSARTPLRAHVSARLNAWRWRSLASTDVVRIALHPQDLASLTTRASLERELTRWASARQAISYASLI